MLLSVRDSELADADGADFDDVPTGDIDVIGSLVTEPVLAVSEDFPLDELIEMAIDHRANAIVVVDAARRVRGVIAPHDLLAGAAQAKGATAGDIVTTAVILGTDTSVACAAALMAEGVDQVVVADARGQLQFVVTARDVARHVATRAGYVGLK